MAAGLAHELNNPAAAVRRAASQLAETLDVVVNVVKGFVEAGIERAGAAQLVELQQRGAADGAPTARRCRPSTPPTPRTTCSTGWRTSASHEPWRYAEALAAAGVDDAWLDARGRDRAGPAPAPRWPGSPRRSAPRGLADELQESRERMSDLVGAIKTYSYMDRGELVQADVREGIDATIKVWGTSSSTPRSIVRKDYDRDLPRLAVHGSELNQVWTNLHRQRRRRARRAAARSRSRPRATALRPRRHRRRRPRHPGGGRAVACSSRSSPPRRSVPGTGLGLDTVRRIVEDRHDGSLAFDTGPGRDDVPRLAADHATRHREQEATP